VWVSYFSYLNKSVGFETEDSENSFQKRNMTRRPLCSLEKYKCVVSCSI